MRNKSPLVVDLKDLKELDDTIKENKQDIAEAFNKMATLTNEKDKNKKLTVKVTELNNLFIKLEEITVLSL